MLRFEYIRALDPPTQDAEEDPTSALDPIPAEPNIEGEAERGEATLDELVVHARHAREEAGADPHAVLATPTPLRFQLPSFLGVPLACARLEPERPGPSVDDSAPARRSPGGLQGGPHGWIAWLGPGMLTMSLAVAATVAFGAFVVTR